MKICHIVPFKNRRCIAGQDYKMFLTHLVLKDEEHAKWARGTKGYKILDNSLIELGDALSLEEVLRAADLIEADEIILPDVFQQGPETLERVRGSLEYLRQKGYLGKYKLMAVCQGRNVEEFVHTFRILEKIPEIDCIGIPKVTAKMHPAGRAYFESIWKYSSKQIHLLGLWYSWGELSNLDDPDRVRSVDTCLAAYLAKYNLDPTSPRADGFTIDLEDKYIFDDSVNQHIRWANALVD